jgi:hypothetical protein
MRINIPSPISTVVNIESLKINQVRILGKLCEAQIALSLMSNKEAYELFNACGVLPENVEKIQLELKENLAFYEEFAKMTKFI